MQRSAEWLLKLAEVAETEVLKQKVNKTLKGITVIKS